MTDPTAERVEQALVQLLDEARPQAAPHSSSVVESGRFRAAGRRRPSHVSQGFNQHP
jgi:hypothetical protein